jgi:rieske iron-sulfur protein
MVDREFRCGVGRIGRRAALELGLCFALAPRLASAQAEAARERPREGDLLVAVSRSGAEPLKPDDLPLDGKQTFAWPMDPAAQIVRNGSRLNKVLLLRLDPDGFDPETKERTVDGVVGYSAICPHTGCDVTTWHPDRQLLECPCHYSIYDPKEGAKVLSGPSPRRLPALPLKIDDGRLVVAKPFIGRPGFQQM